ncbi:YeiH family protein [Catellatospora coxensis]|uniref:Membrane protein n=1 Tax=Catellatospora coxensis TaxID=310354 RepID=A0A8J3PB76_9ACTN|nr:putative sulfate exporter family transporter [Catellatospora coxensis]GIG11026.1 membrane protein [Catellatospora coxensis]
MTMTAPRTAVAVPAAPRPRTLLPAVLTAAAGLGGAALGHRLVPQIGVLTWAVGLGVLAANLNLLPAAGRAGLGLLTKKLLRVGVALLGFSVSPAAITALGAPVLALVATTLVATLAFTTWLGNRMRLGAARSLLLGTGVAICGASAIAAMEQTAGADEEDVTASIAMITLFGTVALVAFPLLQGPLGLSGVQFGVWTGASVHEVGQVVAAAGPAGAAVVATAIVVKLTRVLLLAPVVATVSVIRRLTTPAATGAARPPLVPLFVLGFLGCAALRGTGTIPAWALDGISAVQVTALGAALFGMGASVHLPSLLRKSGPLLAVAAVSTLFITVVALAGVLLLVPGS